MTSTSCYNSNCCFLIFAFVIVCVILHYPKQHVFDVAIKNTSHAVSQQGFLLTGGKKTPKPQIFFLFQAI